MTNASASRFRRDDNIMNVYDLQRYRRYHISNPYEFESAFSSSKSRHEEKRLSFKDQNLPVWIRDDLLIFDSRGVPGLKANTTFNNHSESDEEPAAGDSYHQESHSEGTGVCNPDKVSLNRVYIVLYTE